MQLLKQYFVERVTPFFGSYPSPLNHIVSSFLSNHSLLCECHTFKWPLVDCLGFSAEWLSLFRFTKDLWGCSTKSCSSLSFSQGKLIRAWLLEGNLRVLWLCIFDFFIFYLFHLHSLEQKPTNQKNIRT